MMSFNKSKEAREPLSFFVSPEPLEKLPEQPGDNYGDYTTSEFTASYGRNCEEKWYKKYEPPTDKSDDDNPKK
jgi:hypothetical protein